MHQIFVLKTVHGYTLFVLNQIHSLLDDIQSFISNCLN